MNYHFVIQSVAKDLGNINVDVSVDVHEILPPFGRLDDKRTRQFGSGVRTVAGLLPPVMFSNSTS